MAYAGGKEQPAHLPSESSTATTASDTPTTTAANGRNRRRASLACLNCRKRKIKCYKQSPEASCTSCRSLQIQCLISKDGDRRKTGSRQQVAALQDRVQYLESLVSQGDQRGPQRRESFTQPEYPSQSPRGSSNLSAPDPDSLHTNFAAINRSSAATTRSIDPTFSETPSNARSQHTSATYGAARGSTSEPSKQSFSEHGDIIAPDSRHDVDQNLAGRSGGNSTGLSNPSQQVLGSTLRHTTGRLTPLSEKGGERLEIDENQGRPRFYGPTSQLYIQRRSVSHANEASCMASEATEDLKMDLAPLRSLLFQTYWKIQPYSVITVDEALFRTGRVAAIRSEYYSEFLENSLLACATRVSTSEGVRALGPRYAERAKVDIVQELETPNIATLQGFLLLSDFEATRGRDRLGYTYCGISCRLAFDLGLPESCDKLIAQGRMTTLEARSRHTLLLGTFVYDKLWSLYLGRPSAIPIAILEAAHDHAIASGWTGPSTIGPWAGLCVDMSEVTDILNGLSPLDSDARERLNNLDTRIRHRYENLPFSLQLRPDEIAELPASAYSLHIQFCGLRIVLHRLLSKTISQAAADGISPRREAVEHSLGIMYENAIRIARLVSAYQQIFGIENVITVMLDNMYVAATVLISHLLRPSPHDSSIFSRRDMQWLRSLADILVKAERHYPVTFRMLSTLSTLVENSVLAGMFGTFESTGAMPHAVSSETLDQAAGSFYNTSNQRQDLFVFDPSEQIMPEMDIQNMMSWAN